MIYDLDLVGIDSLQKSSNLSLTLSERFDIISLADASVLE